MEASADSMPQDGDENRGKTMISQTCFMELEISDRVQVGVVYVEWAVTCRAPGVRRHRDWVYGHQELTLHPVLGSAHAPRSRYPEGCTAGPEGGRGAEHRRGLPERLHTGPGVHTDKRCQQRWQSYKTILQFLFQVSLLTLEMEKQMEAPGGKVSRKMVTRRTRKQQMVSKNKLQPRLRGRSQMQNLPKKMNPNHQWSRKLRRPASAGPRRSRFQRREPSPDRPLPRPSPTPPLLLPRLQVRRSRPSLRAPGDS